MLRHDKRVVIVSDVPNFVKESRISISWNKSELLNQSVNYFEDECVHKLELR